VGRKILWGNNCLFIVIRKESVKFSSANWFTDFWSFVVSITDRRHASQKQNKRDLKQWINSGLQLSSRSINTSKYFIFIKVIKAYCCGQLALVIDLVKHFQHTGTPVDMPTSGLLSTGALILFVILCIHFENIFVRDIYRVRLGKFRSLNMQINMLLRTLTKELGSWDFFKVYWQ